jgi:hypothetical protein
VTWTAFVDNMETSGEPNVTSRRFPSKQEAERWATAEAHRQTEFGPDGEVLSPVRWWVRDNGRGDD